MNWRNRSVFFVLLGLIVGLHLHQTGRLAAGWAWLVLQFAVYPQVIYQYARRSVHPRRAEERNMALDGFCFGIWIVWLGLPLWISFIMFIAVCVNLVVFKGPTGLAELAGVVVAGMLLGAAIFWPPVWAPDTSLTVSLLCMAVLTAFLVVFARDGYLRAKGLYESRRQAQRQLDEIRMLQVRLHDMALRDPLTGLFNRRSLDTALAEALARCQQAREPLCVLMIDIDHFKHINDTHGHPAGDAVLQALAHLLQSHVRASDLAIRMGGEEFLLALPNVPIAQAQERAQALRTAFVGLLVA
jgi:GGDEF domain-containing protein